MANKISAEQIVDYTIYKLTEADKDRLQIATGIEKVADRFATSIDRRNKALKDTTILDLCEVRRDIIAMPHTQERPLDSKPTKLWESGGEAVFSDRTEVSLSGDKTYRQSCVDAVDKAIQDKCLGSGKLAAVVTFFGSAINEARSVMGRQDVAPEVTHHSVDKDCGNVAQR